MMNLGVYEFKVYNLYNCYYYKKGGGRGDIYYFLFFMKIYKSKIWLYQIVFLVIYWNK